MTYDPDRDGPRVLGPGFNDRVFAVVRTVPRGRVTTFGDVAGALGWARAARQVGRALAALPGQDTEVPWQRVVLASGKVPCGPRQASLLRAEGVDVGASGLVAEFDRRRWKPRVGR
ncbi:MAG: MGMT family protein [Planctomycetes bacterium]|nr:MGMT family protein [Planctomycetota bacterium]